MSLQNVLVAVDVFDAACERIVARAVEYVPSPVVIRLVHVVEEPVPLAADDTQFDGRERTRLREFAETRLAALCEKHGLSGYLIDFGHPASGIHRVVDEQCADLVMLGGEGKSGWRALFGSTATAVLRGTPCNVVALAQSDPSQREAQATAKNRHAYQRILAAIALDNLAEASQILDEAVRLANLHGAQLSVLNVVQLPTVRANNLVTRVRGVDRARLLAEALDRTYDRAREILSDVTEPHNLTARLCHVHVGNPVAHIQAMTAELQTELLVLGTHGLHGLHSLVGSTTKGVINNQSCDVLAVRLHPSDQLGPGAKSRPAKLAGKQIPEDQRDREHISLH